MKRLLIIALFATGCTTIGVKRECEYKIPDGYALVYDQRDGDYAISPFRGRLLYDAWFFIGYAGNATNAAKFSDSCKAKGYCHDYMNQMEAEKGDFIDVKELK